MTADLGSFFYFLRSTNLNSHLTHETKNGCGYGSGT